MKSSLIFRCFFLSIICFDNLSFSLAMEMKVLPSPQKEAKAYGGFNLKQPIQHVPVSTCLSLGGGCLDKVNHLLQQSDEFIVSFMYRFNSPTLMKTLEDQYLKNVPTLVFLDYNQVNHSVFSETSYHHYVQHLIESVPTSLVQLGNKAFHHKVTIAKRKGSQAIVIIGSANLTYEADNEHSEDMVIIQSNQLADLLLEAFSQLLRMDPQSRKTSEHLLEPKVNVFHEHRLIPGQSNIDVLTEWRQKLASSQDLITLGGGPYGDIVYLGISTGFIDRGGINPCLSIMNQVLENQDNAFLFFFENYISLDKSFMNQSIGQNLLNPIPKLMVLHRDKTNKIMAQTLKTPNNTIMLHRPYTEKKFHHKLLIQYLTQEEPLILTGSFNLSTNAIKNNSETIIGIRSADLADEYLATPLLNSGLGEQPDVWEVLSKWKKYKKAYSTPLDQVAERLLKKCQNNMNRYDDVLERIEQHIVHTIPPDDTTLAIEKRFAEVKRVFKEGSSSDTIQALETLIDHVFDESKIIPLYAKHLEERLKIIKRKNKDENLDTALSLQGKTTRKEIKRWFKDILVWIQELKTKSIKGVVNIKAIETIHKDFYKALKDLENYEQDLLQWSELENRLIEFLTSKDKEKQKE